MTVAADLDALAQGLAGLHAEAFDTPWSAAAFADLLGQAGVVLEGGNDGFILIRTVADEA
jgi:ribosomal-protein-alanine N-acetyltransferase